ncbi:MAG: ornithine cyclodeaminase family protein [Betaproteobacteria bacterium]|nr:ornithine cyclodeaminase family protein [Betaproteobacteria bacterium]
MIPFFSSEQIRQALPFKTLISAMSAAFQDTAEAPRRHVHPLSDTGSSTLLLMPVWQANAHLGVKLVTVVPENQARQLPTVQALFILLDATTGTPLALMDGEELTLRRTAAASALASTFLSRSDSEHLLIVGTGQLAPHMAAAHCAVRGIRRITVWGRDLHKAKRTINKIQALGLQTSVAIDAAEDLGTASMTADLISCATTSRQALLQSTSVRPGTHIDLVGGFKPDMREADDELVSAARLFVDTFDAALVEAGDLVQPMQAGLITRASILAELSDLASGRHAGRSNAQEITLFKSVGTAIEDLCAANLVWQHFKAPPSQSETDQG